MDPPARVALAAAFFRFFENDSSGETAAISDQSRRARGWPLGHYQHKRGNKMKHRCNARKGDGTVTDHRLSRASRNARLKPLLCDAPDVRTRHFRKRIGTGAGGGALLLLPSSATSNAAKYLE